MPETPGSPDSPETPDAPDLSDVTGYTSDGVPTLDHVRATVEGRHALALGEQELVGERPEVADVTRREADREDAGRARLEEIRRSLGER